jgi:GT2 family glycosyltransferase
VSRPAVSVVMPFAGTHAAAEAALTALEALRTGPEDELILADNSGTAPASDAVLVVRALVERSPSHARNVGAAHARRDWVLFLDSDCTAPADLVDRYFSEPIAADVGALAGAVAPAPDGVSFAGRYGAAKGFLSQDAHLAHWYMARAVAANLLVRRVAFDQVGGFFEGVRAAEDTDFSWRIQRAGWRLEGRPKARVEHRYRTTVGALRRQWRGYAAGRAWLGRRYEGFAPEPALTRAATRALGLRALGLRAPSVRPSEVHPPEPVSADGGSPGRLERGGFLALDALLGVEELAGLALSNRPRRNHREPARVVLVADRFPALGDPLADFARTLAAVRVEAVGRPEAVALAAARELIVDYREDDGAAARAAALVRVLVRHPLRCVLDRARRRPGEPRLAALAPAVRRLGRDAQARVYPLGGDEARAAAARIAALAGRPLES